MTFIDKEFDTNLVLESQEVLDDDVSSKDVIWMRIPSVVDAWNKRMKATHLETLNLEECIFPKNKEDWNISQGILKDCFLISAIQICLSSTHLLEKILVDSTFNPQGEYTFQFYDSKEAKWVKVTIDDSIPVYKREEKINEEDTIEYFYPAFAHDKVNHYFWPSLLEKAYAKFVGNCYQVIHGGNVSEAMHDLTSLPVEDFNLAKDTNHEIKLNTIKQYLQLGCICACARTEKKRVQLDNIEILTNHAYGVVNVKGNKLVLSNPHNNAKEELIEMTMKKFLKNFNRL
mmetsp:Transcript_1037/g.1615  ORF Transcript_1037/g.1615 Transcript_1037/m.1615 type:complete len:287 (+) Transcript_1037:20-880(+)